MSSDKKRTRNFASVVYPESAPENWIEILQQQCVPAFVSPLHNSDYNPSGEPKKEHFHVMIMFDGVKTIEQAREVFESIGGVGVEMIKSVRAYARYLCHLDNPDKAKYSLDDVTALAGADYVVTINSSADKYTAIGEMIDFCVSTGIDSYAELIIYAKNNRMDWFRILCDNGTLPVVQFLKSRYWEMNNAIKN